MQEKNVCLKNTSNNILQGNLEHITKTLHFQSTEYSSYYIIYGSWELLFWMAKKLMDWAQQITIWYLGLLLLLHTLFMRADEQSCSMVIVSSISLICINIINICEFRTGKHCCRWVSISSEGLQRKWHEEYIIFTKVITLKYGKRGKKLRQETLVQQLSNIILGTYLWCLYNRRDKRRLWKYDDQTLNNVWLDGYGIRVE